jgi:hypothetical protein
MWQTALLGAFGTGTAPAQQVDITKYYNDETQPQDNTILYIAVIAALLVVAGTVYFVTK